jgi:protein Tex
VLEGSVTNVAAFGAFVDIGVHQDGLVHVSAMSKTFVKDPRSVVKPGDIVRVKVLEVDQPRKRISLSLRLDDEIGAQPSRSSATERVGVKRNVANGPSRNANPSGGAFADAFQRAGLRKPT